MDQSTSLECQRCRRDMAMGSLYLLRSGVDNVLRCLWCALLHPPTLGRSLAAAAIVGSILIAINQGDVLLSGDGLGAMVWKVPLTYATPFAVSLWGMLTNARG